MNDYQQADAIAKQTWISGSLKATNKKTSNQDKERSVVIRLWNEGYSIKDIAQTIRKSIPYVNYYMKRFKYFYGEQAIKHRAVPLDMPRV